MTWIVNAAGLLLVAWIIWWFWLSKKQIATVADENIIEIKVKDGVYQPAIIKVKADQLVTLRFIREDATPCAEFVLFPALNMSKPLPLNKATDVALKIANPGEYEFTCQMAMYRGKLIVA